MAIRLADMTHRGSRDNGNTIVRSWHVDTEDEIYQAVADNPAYRGFAATGDWDSQTWDRDTIDAGFVVNIVFGSIDPDDLDPTGDEYGGDVAKWDLNPAFEKEPIEKHWDISNLIKDYEGDEDPKTKRVIFPRLLKSLPRNDKRGLIGKSRGTDDEITNPLFGMSQSGYLVMGGLATAKYITDDISRAFSGVGQVFASLPSNAPDYGLPRDRDFIKVPPTFSEVARAEDGTRYYTIQHGFMLSDKGGWPPGVYEFIEL